MKRVKNIAQKMPRKKWQKHQQTVEQNPGEELPKINSYVDDFIEQNNKQNMLIAVIEEGLNRKLPYEKIGAIINDFLNYRDEPAPGLVAKWRERQIKINNRKNRENVLAEMIEKFKDINTSM